MYLPNVARSAPRLRHLLALATLLLLTFLFGGARAATVTLTPTAYTTTTGSDGGQAVASSLAILDQTGTANTWEKYVEFTPASAGYAGYQSFKLPTTVTPSGITALQVTVNYQGPASATQVWTWQIYNWSTAAYVTLGTNAGAPAWGAWKQLSFAASGNLASYINPADGGLRIQLKSNNASDSCDIDYVGVLVTYGAGTGTGGVTGVTVTPVSVGVVTGASQQFTAAVAGGTNSAVTWSVSSVNGGNSTVGTISASGLYVAPAAVPSPGTVTVRATSQADTTKSATASATVTAAASGVVAVTVTPASAAVQTGLTQQFTATVAGSTNAAVNWAVNGIAGGNTTLGTVSTSGLYRAPATVPGAPQVTVSATAQADTTKQASASATITAAPVAAGPIYYVSTSGVDTANGSASAPWRTIAKALGVVNPGDTVYVRAGTYSEVVNLTRSGTAELPIVVQSAPGELAIIDGTGKVVGEAESGLVSLTDVSYVTFAGFEVRNFTSASANSVPIGIHVNGAGTQINVLRNHIHHISNTSSNSGERNALGLAVFGTKTPNALDHVTIGGNELNNLTLGNSESMSINGNVTNWVVSDNVVHDNDNIGIDAIGFESKVSNATYDQARDGLISGNLVYNITSSANPAYGGEYSADGIYVDGGARIVIENNTVHHTDYGIELASEHSGKATSDIIARNNLVWASNNAGITIGGYDSKRGSTENVTIVNNTLLLNNTRNTGEGEFQMQYYAKNVVFKNNIVYASPQNVFLLNTASTVYVLDMDYNLYYSTAGAGSAEFYHGKQYSTFAAWQVYGKDANSRFADPQLTSISLAAPNLKPLASSPAISRGIDLGDAVVGTVDFAKQPRQQGPTIDIGAYEQ